MTEVLRWLRVGGREDWCGGGWTGPGCRGGWTGTAGPAWSTTGPEGEVGDGGVGGPGSSVTLFWPLDLSLSRHHHCPHLQPHDQTPGLIAAGRSGDSLVHSQRPPCPRATTPPRHCSGHFLLFSHPWEGPRPRGRLPPGLLISLLASKAASSLWHLERAQSPAGPGVG